MAWSASASHGPHAGRRGSVLFCLGLGAVLVDRVWNDGAEYVDENALSVTVKRLRDKLEDTPSRPQYLKTVYGIGYTWADPLRPEKQTGL